MPFQPGQSGNPKGRARIPDDVKAAAKAATPKAIETLVRALDDRSPRVRILAAEKLLVRAWGPAFAQGPREPRDEQAAA